MVLVEKTDRLYRNFKDWALFDELGVEIHLVKEGSFGRIRAPTAETLLSNCTLQAGTLCPTYRKPFDALVSGNETGNWLGVRDDFRNWFVSIAA